MGFHHFLCLFWSLSEHTVADDDDDGEGPPNRPELQKSPGWEFVQVKDARCHNEQCGRKLWPISLWGAKGTTECVQSFHDDIPNANYVVITWISLTILI